jgi:Flp pilus assembly protein TadG
MEGRLMPRAAMTLSHCRSGNFAVIFALTLPVFAAIIAFIGDQANMMHLQSRVSRARDAAIVAAAQEFIMGNRPHAQLEAHAKDFFLANLGEEYREVTTVRLTTPKSLSSGGITLETHVKYEPLFAPVFAAATGQPASGYAVDIQ